MCESRSHESCNWIIIAGKRRERGPQDRGRVHPTWIMEHKFSRCSYSHTIHGVSPPSTWTLSRKHFSVLTDKWLQIRSTWIFEDQPLDYIFRSFNLLVGAMKCWDYTGYFWGVSYEKAHSKLASGKNYLLVTQAEGHTGNMHIFTIRILSIGYQDLSVLNN